MRYHGRMDDFEKKWKRIQDQLRIQMNGDEQPTFSSGRTLFGIRSAAEEKMDRFAREIEEEARQRRVEAPRRYATAPGSQPTHTGPPRSGAR